MSKRAGLGKGLGALIPEGVDIVDMLDEGERIRLVAVKIIYPSPDQPRTVFDEGALQELADSIKQYGIIQPLVVSPMGDNYIIIAGERRWRAARIAGLDKVPVVIRTTEDLERLSLALIENVQRVDLSSLEQAVSVERLHQQFNLGYADIAKRLGKATSTVNNIVRLLQLPDEAKTALAEGKISEGHARQILALKDLPEKQATLLGLIIQNGWSVRRAESFVADIKENGAESPAPKKPDPVTTPDTKRLTKRFGTEVRVRRLSQGGRLEIVFKDDDQLARLLAELQKPGL